MSRCALVASLLLALATGCAAARPHAVLQPLSSLGADAPTLLEQNHFQRDLGVLGDLQLKEILAAPVFLEEHARIGVLPVREGYAPDERIPVEAAPATLADALEGSGLFDLASELGAEWPTSTGTAGLRELAARYRSEYVLLYRHRFDDVTRANGFAAGFVTLVGALFLPGTTIETSGVLEATLFDVKTGTILFTVHERVRREEMAVPPAVEGRLQVLHREMVAEAAKKLSEQVIARCQRLVATRPANRAPVAEVVPSS